MEKSRISKKALLALGAVALGTTGVQASNNTDLGESATLRTQIIDAQSEIISFTTNAELKCGEAKCGEKKEKTKEAKCGEAKCGEKKKAKKAKKEKTKEAKCGESKCGEGKCGE